MKKIFLNILFVILHSAISYLGVSLLMSYWFGIDSLQHHSVGLVSVLVILPISCTYLYLMSKSLIETIPSIICFGVNLLLYGYITLGAFALRSLYSYFKLSLLSISHSLVFIALVLQCCFFISWLPQRIRRNTPMKEFKSPPRVIARTQRIHNSVWFTLFKKHYCPGCSAKLQLIKKTKLIVSNAPGANNRNGILSEVSPEENIRFIWKEFQCPNCKTEFTIEHIKKIEQNM